MDFLRLPAPLRRSIIASQDLNTLSPPPIDNTSPSTTNIISTYQPPPPSINTLNTYTHTPAPTRAQLKYAHTFFHSSPPHLLYSAPIFRTLPPSPTPEVAFLGRSNVGKSSLLNALFGRSRLKDAHVSKRPGRTRTMNGFGVTGPDLELGAAPATGDQKGAIWRRFPRGGLVVVDMPGYGSGSREEWGKEVLKYLERRKQLRRTFVLVDAEHGLKKSDLEILVHLRRSGVGHQVVLSKVDKLLWSGSKAPSAGKLELKTGALRKICKEVGSKVDAEAGDGRSAITDILCCSAEKSLTGHRKIGVDEIRWAVLRACGMDCDEFGQRRQYSLQDLHILEDEDDES